MGTLFLIYTYANLPRPQHLNIESTRKQIKEYSATTFHDGGPRNKANFIMDKTDSRFLHRKKRNKNDGTWIPFGDKAGVIGYGFSAFYDDRISLASLPVVRIIVVAQEFDHSKVWCELTYKNGTSNEYVLMSPSDIGAGVYRSGKEYKEYLFSCYLLHEHVPEMVGLVTKKGDESTFYMPVEISERPLQRENFGMCVSVTYWKHDPHQIVEWMEFLRLMGISQVSVYNNSLEAEPARVFQHYDREGFVDFRQSHNFLREGGELTIHMHMSPVINDCMYRNLYKYKKILVADLDEMVVPQTTDNYYDMVVAIEQREAANGNSHPAKHYLFRNNYFFLDTPNGEDRTQSRHLVTLRHRKKVPVSENGYAIKSMIDPIACKNMHNHYCWKSTPLYANGYEHVEVEPYLALNQHYKKCHLDFWVKPGACREEMRKAVWDQNILRFKGPLEKAVSAKLKILGLDPL